VAQKDAAAPRAGQTTQDVMAVVNGQDIKRDALGTACVERFGKDVLEGLVNKRLIMHYCRNRNIEQEIRSCEIHFHCGCCWQRCS